jgi:hypothetical protein
MGWTFRKRKRLLPGLDLNVGRRGLGLSFGRRGARLSVNTRGQKGASLGWKGLFWRKRL